MGDEQTLLIAFRTRGGKTRIKIEQALEEFHIPRDHYRLTTLDEESVAAGEPPARARISLRYSNAHHRHYDFLAYLACIDDIEEIRDDAKDPPMPQREAGA